MKGAHYFALLMDDPDIDKLHSFNLVKLSFVNPVTSNSLRRDPFFQEAVVGIPVDLAVWAMQSVPTTDLVFSALIATGGRSHFRGSLSVNPPRTGRRFFKCHYVKEYIMTITNHIRRIEDLAELVLMHVDDREYGKAHLALVDIEIRTRLAQEHVDHLQQVTPRELVPVGGD